ncbi:TMV resistance protein N-like [Punica granatum]|uniref:TMV resistance protein N-like n=1 Tax=Punica granatum TaxID=22663 RepID=A0A6P8CYA5_PUNGR|nr:TMV resistance protein N-like [Punica granatum]
MGWVVLERLLLQKSSIIVSQRALKAVAFFQISGRHKRMKNCCQNLQTKLISGILKRECDEITSADEGISYMREVFCNMKVLIVLDDVDRMFNLTELIGELDTFGPGSRIIVTSRYEKDLPRVDQTFEVPELCRWEVQLHFSSYTDANCPPFNKLAAEIVSVVGGLPLVVEVIGSFLFGKGVAVWTETLQKLKLIPYEGVQKKLMISYEASDAPQKQMFLDIACSVNGEDLQIASYTWHEFSTSHLSGGSKYQHLSSLMKIGDDNELWMHVNVATQISRWKLNLRQHGETAACLRASR